MFLGIDYGTKRVGVAVSDEEDRVAFPLEVVASKDAFARIHMLVSERHIKGIVIGESKNFSGVDNPLMQNIRDFAQELGKATGIRIIFEPEFMTSAAAGREGETAEQRLDASAAALILQSFLDKRRAIE